MTAELFDAVAGGAAAAGTETLDIAAPDLGDETWLAAWSLLLARLVGEDAARVGWAGRALTVPLREDATAAEWVGEVAALAAANPSGPPPQSAWAPAGRDDIVPADESPALVWRRAADGLRAS